MSPRAKAPFIKVNCAALPRELIESELFGSVKGAYTGALSDRDGLFRQAEGGTLLLDELSEMPVDTQTKLLRVLQDREYRPVGGHKTYHADCRIIATTNRDVNDAITQGKLREDLYYRISTVCISLPPLRERREDIPVLANTFLQRFAAQAGRNVIGFTSAALQALTQNEWPGNVRQLQNQIQRALLMSEGTHITPQNLSIDTSGLVRREDGLTLLEAMERNAIIQVLKETNGNKNAASRRLGIGRQTLYNKLRRYSVDS
ncbi:MAG: sigma-54 dependent transcriptional regulator, partial [Verrucomicrobia bacterium]|nr:sigma-54 dependent transcriptional regulator [Verrucomicrobiota bacterium]